MNNLYIQPIKKDYKKVNSFDECVGNKDMYESCLDYIESISGYVELDTIVSKVLNKYEFGISSCLYHPLIRLGYAIEGYSKYKTMAGEVKRALAYYITACKPRGIFTKYRNSFRNKNLELIFNSSHINTLIKDKDTLEERLNTLYNDEKYLDMGFVISGDEYKKSIELLMFIEPMYNKNNNIVLLHCITGLHSLIILKDYFKDFNEALDILTTSVITNIVATDIEYSYILEEDILMSWKYIYSKAMDTVDAHSIKLTYSTFELERIFDIPELRLLAQKRLNYL